MKRTKLKQKRAQDSIMVPSGFEPGAAGWKDGRRRRIHWAPRPFLKWADPGFFFVYFWSFRTNNTILTKTGIVMSIQYTVRDSNPRLLKHQSSPITTIPGLPLRDLFFTLPSVVNETPILWSKSSDQSYKYSTVVNYDSRVVIYCIFKSVANLINNLHW